jgi:hypothetical protein
LEAWKFWLEIKMNQLNNFKKNHQAMMVIMEENKISHKMYNSVSAQKKRTKAE